MINDYDFLLKMERYGFYSYINLLVHKVLKYTNHLTYKVYPKYDKIQSSRNDKTRVLTPLANDL